MLIKIKDHRIVASEVMYFGWYENIEENEDALHIIFKCQDHLNVVGPRTLLDEFEKQYN